MQKNFTVEALEEHERKVQGWEAAIERHRVAEQYPERINLTSRSQMLCVLKYQAEEMRSVILADED